ncbi:MAG: aconitase X catalytic domain-containing protein [Zestosphaera sp.]
MYLTKDEEAILNGERGYPYMLAMRVITAVGESLNAERLIPVAHVHVSGISYFNIGDAGLEFIESLAASDARFTAFTTANPYAALMDTSYGRLPGDAISKQSRIVSSLRRMGSATFTCAPYYVRKPSYGEHLAWAESNAVLYVNSLIGARSNREGGPLALLEGLVGRTYAAGVHLEEGRRPSCIVSVKAQLDWGLKTLSLVGLKVGELCPDSIPFVRGLEGVPEVGAKAFLAAFGSTSNAPMVIFNELTPDSEGLLAGSDLRERITVDAELLRESDAEVREVCEGGGVLYFIGCPHLSQKELAAIVDYVVREGKSFGGNEEVPELWLGVGEGVQLDEGLVDTLNNMGVRLARGMCPVTTRLDLMGVKCVVTDSGKALHYMPKLAGVKVVLKERHEILKEFLHGG